MRMLQRHGISRIVLADVGKNLFAFVRGAKETEIDVLAIADDGLAAEDRRYRGIPVLSTGAALALTPQLIVVSNMSYAHAIRRRSTLADLTRLPVVEWSIHPRDDSNPTQPPHAIESTLVPATAF